MEARLEQYRSSTRRREFFNNIRRQIRNMVEFQPRSNTKKDETIVMSEESRETTPDIVDLTQDSDTSDAIMSDTNEDAKPTDDIDPTQTSKFQYVAHFIWFCFWLTCWFIAIELRFGIVFLMFSALFGIYFNTRTKPKGKHEVSAYSVFNENCESINGTLKAEQFDAEIRYGPMNTIKT